MTPAADPFMADVPQHRTGDFYRTSRGTPIVDHPTELLKDGTRARKVQYGRPSGLGKIIEDMYSIQKWAERQVVYGIGLDTVDGTVFGDPIEPGPVALRAFDLAKDNIDDRDSKEWKDEADSIVAAAKRLAKADIAADRGIHAHGLTEDNDEGRDIIARIEAGEQLGLDESTQHAIVQSWRDMLERDGLTILATEATVVHDQWRQAGTLDRVARLNRNLRFRLSTGEIVELPAGTVVILDIKSGKRRLRDDGTIMYWQSYAVQVAVYAGAVQYDTETGIRTPYPWHVDEHWALIAHLDVLGAIDGQPSCELVLVDIEAGRAATELCLAAKAWEARKDVFSVAQLVVEGSAPRDNGTLIADPSTTLGDGGVHAPRLGDGGAPTTPLAIAKAQLTAEPDQGDDMTDAAIYGETWAVLQRHYSELDKPAKAWIGELINAAARHNVPFHARQIKSARVFELYRGLIALCAGGGDDDELLRALLELIIGDVALFPGVHPGHALGSLGATEATRFANLVDQWNHPGLPTYVDADHKLRFQHFAA